METNLCKMQKTKVFKLKVDMIPVSSLLIVVNTNRRLEELKEGLLKAGFKQTENDDRIKGTFKLGGTEFPVLIDLVDGLKTKHVDDDDYDKEFPMSLAISIDYQKMKEPEKEKEKKEKLQTLAKKFISEYKITKILEKAERANQ